jgi:ferredoxin
MTAPTDVVVTVDPHLCMGVRSCLQVAPRSFVLDHGTTARGVADPVDDVSTLIEAASSCPNFAITVSVDGEVVFDPERQ